MVQQTTASAPPSAAFEFPLLYRELRAVARRATFGRLRTLAAAACAAPPLIAWIFEFFVSHTRADLAAYFELFIVFVGMYAGAMLVIAAVLAPTLIVRDKEDNIAPILFLAGVKPRQIVIAKLLGLCIPLWQLLLVPMPLLVIAHMLGAPGAQHELVRAIPVAFAIPVAAALGLFGSVLARTAGAAIVLGLLFIAGWTYPCIVLEQEGILADAAIVNGLLGAMRGNPFPDSALEWGLMALSHAALTIAVTLCASLLMPWALREKRTKQRTPRMRRPGPGGPKLRFITSNGEGFAQFLRTCRLAIPAAIVLMAGAWYSPWVIVAGLLLMCYDIGASASQNARQGLLLELMLTPADDRSAARTLVEGYLVHTWIYGAGLLFPSLYWLTELYQQTASEMLEYPGNWAYLGWPLVLIWVPLMLLAIAVLYVMAALAAGNLGFQGAGTVRAALAGAAVALELAFIAIPAAYLLSYLTQTLTSLELRAFAFPIALLMLAAPFALWYYPRYRKSLRDALFEDPAKKRKNW